MTQSNRWMLFRRLTLLCLISLLALVSVAAATEEGLEAYKPYTEHPRLFLTPRRLRLLQKESQRDSIRWEVWKKALEKPQSAEPGFAAALLSQVTQNPKACETAVKWAASPKASDLRQVAIVFDWCQSSLSASTRRELAAQMKASLGLPLNGMTLEEVRDQILIAIALAGHAGDLPAQRLREILTRWWPEQIVKPILAGKNPIARRDLYPLWEILHATRDNLQIDLREKIPGFFKDLPLYYVIGHYPAPFPSNVGLFRIPAEKGLGQPEQRAAELSRMAGLAMVAYDGNSQEAQFAQGWLIDDRYLLQTPFGAPYEYLWANPYLPGLPFDRQPRVFYQPVFGELYVRSNWSDDGEWIGYLDGEVQLMREGNFSTKRISQGEAPLVIGEAVLAVRKIPTELSLPASEAERLFLLDLPKDHAYDVEFQDQELLEYRTDQRGILDLPLFPKEPGKVWIHEVGQPLEVAEGR